MHNTYLCQAFMHLCVQQIADAFKFQYVISIVLVTECAIKLAWLKYWAFSTMLHVGLFINLQHLNIVHETQVMFCM